MQSKPPNVEGVEFLTPKKIAQAGIASEAKQEKMRKAGTGWRYYKVGQQIIAHPDDVAEWLANGAAPGPNADLSSLGAF